MRGISRLLPLVVLGACGRIAFDPVGGGTGSGTDDGGSGGDTDGTGGPVPGLIAWFKLDENSGSAAYDSIIMSDWGLVQGGTWVPGHSGSALAFNGDGDNVGIGALTRFNNLPRLSVSAWINPTAVTDDGQRHCVFAKAETTTAGWAILVGQSGDGSIGFEAYYGGSTAMQHSAGGVVVVSQWQHVVVTWGGSGMSTDILMYRNGGAIGGVMSSSSAAARPDDATESATINCYGLAGFAGVIDDVKIFDAVLTPAEVASLYVM